jgi:hypothetical protein
MSRTPRLLGLAFALLLGVPLTACGPLGPLAGGRLYGDVHTAPVSDRSFTGAVETVQLETNPSDPYSVNTWCGDYQGALYVPTSLILGTDDPAERTWVKNVEADPNVRVRIEGTVYPLRAVRVEDPVELDAVRAVLLGKYDVALDAHSSGAWIFRLEPR